MAERTITGVEVQNKTGFYSHCGQELQVAYGHYNFARGASPTTVSNSLVIQMVGLPDQARVQEIIVSTSGFGGTGGYVVGDSSLSNRFITAASLSVAAGGQMVQYMNQPGGRNYKVSLTASDNNILYTVNLEINGGATATASGCIAMCVYYTIDINAT